jgi:hypothetical protein
MADRLMVIVAVRDVELQAFGMAVGPRTLQVAVVREFEEWFRQGPGSPLLFKREV